VNDPCQWKGANMLGWALMCARSTLRVLTIAPEAVPAAPAQNEVAPANAVDDVPTVSKQSCAASSTMEITSAPQQLVAKCAGGRRARAAPGPGQNVTRATLTQQWRGMKKTQVLGFYGHGAYAGEHACFSNFFEAPFEFQMPQEFCQLNLTAEQRTFWVPFSEAAIMACKAAAMGDEDSFVKITTSRGVTQGEIKQFGREIIPFSEEVWDEIVCSVAYEVVYQKFSFAFGDTLLRTGDCLIAEATRNDKNWGIGIDMGDERVNNPCQWEGANMLGWALMLARSTLRESARAAVADVPQAVKASVRTEVDSTDCTEDALASSGIESSKAFPEVQGNAAGSKSRKWRRKKDDNSNNA